MPEKIGQYEIARAMSDIDAESEEHQDQVRFWERRGFDCEAIKDCAMQEGLKVVMVQQGRRPSGRLEGVVVTPEEAARQVIYAAVWLSGMACMHRLLKEQS